MTSLVEDQECVHLWNNLFPIPLRHLLEVELFSSKNLADVVIYLWIAQGSLDANRSISFPAHFPDDTKRPVAYYVQWFILRQKWGHIWEEGMRGYSMLNPNIASKTPNRHHVTVSYILYSKPHTKYSTVSGTWLQYYNWKDKEDAI